MNPFNKGDRIVPNFDSDIFRMLHGSRRQRWEGRVGTVVAQPKKECVTVLWDGSKSKNIYHHKFVLPLTIDRLIKEKE